MSGHISTLVWTRFFLLKKTQLCCCSLRLPQLSASLMASVICVSHPSRFVFGFRFWIVLLCLCVCDSVVVFVCVIVWTRFNNGFMYLWMSSIWVPSSFNFFSYILSGFMAKAFKFQFFFFFLLSGFTLSSLIIHGIGFSYSFLFSLWTRTKTQLEFCSFKPPDLFYSARYV